MSSFKKKPQNLQIDVNETPIKTFDSVEDEESVLAESYHNV